MPRTERALATACLLLFGCARAERPVTLAVGEVRVSLVPPAGWEHVDQGGRHEFRRGDMRISLVDEGLATPEALASACSGLRQLLETGREREALERLPGRGAPVLAARDRDARAKFWRDWTTVATDPSRRTAHHLAPALEALIVRAADLPPLDGRTFARWVVARELDTLRYQVQSLAPAPAGDSAWWVARTWNRVSHLEPRRFAARAVEGRLLVLDSGAHLPPEGEAAYEALLTSIEFPDALPRRARS
jgi:hypothetical protein